MAQCGCLHFSGVGKKRAAREILFVPWIGNRNFNIPIFADGGGFCWIDFVVPATYAGGGLTIKVTAYSDHNGAQQGWLALGCTQMAAAGSAVFDNITNCPILAGGGFFPGTSWLDYVTPQVHGGLPYVQTEFVTAAPTVYDYAIPASCLAIPLVEPTGGGQTLVPPDPNAGLYYVDDTGLALSALAYFPQYQGLAGACLSTNKPPGSHAYAAGDGISLQMYGGALAASGNLNVSNIQVTDGHTTTTLDLTKATIGFGIGLALEWSPQAFVGPYAIQNLNNWFIKTV